MASRLEATCESLLCDHNAPVVRLVAIPTGEAPLLASATCIGADDIEDPAIVVWETQRGTRKHRLTGASRPPNAIVVLEGFADGCPRLASGGHDCAVHIWQPITGTHERRLDGAESYVLVIAALPPSTGHPRVAAGTLRGTVLVWDAVTGKAERTFSVPGHATFSLTAVPCTSPGAPVVLATGHSDGGVRLWDVDGGTANRTFSSIGDPVYGLGWLPPVCGSGSAGSSGSSAAPLLACLRVDALHLWDVAPGGRHRTVDVSRIGPFGVGSPFLLLPPKVTDTGPRLVVYSDKTLYIVDAATMAPIRRLRGHTDRISLAVLLPAHSDVRRVATGSHDGTIRVWDADAGRCEHVLTGHLGALASLVVLPPASHDDGLTRLASGGYDNDVRVWALPESAWARRALAVLSWQALEEA